MSAGADTPVAEDAEVDEAENGEAADAPDLFAWLSREVHELCSSHVPRIAGPPSAITFLRDHVASNRPCVVRGAFDHWPALQKWTPEYLSEVMGDAEVSGMRAQTSARTHSRTHPHTHPCVATHVTKA